MPRLDAATTATEAGALDTTVIADVDVLSGLSLCCTARKKQLPRTSLWAD